MKEDEVDGVVELTGEVRSADLTASTLTLRLEDGTEIPCVFAAEHEATVTRALHEHGTKRLSVMGRAEVSRSNGATTTIVVVEELTLKDPRADARKPPTKPIWEVFEEAMKDIPPEELAKLPIDGAEEHDHYIYGTPKRNA